MMRLFDIQHFCVQDGPGIRTTVFLKGCPLHCRWCHNPESLRPEKQLLFYRDKCIDCGNCVRVCGNGAHLFSGGTHIYRKESCSRCGDCVKSCANRALELSGYEKSGPEVFKEIWRDRAFYGTDGGVTFSGGEPLLQYEELEEVLKACRDRQIHTAVETSLFVPEQVVQKAEGLVDLMICDYKIADSKLHREYTGVGNERILSNLSYLLERRAERMWVRTPVIPRVNDREENMEAMGRFLAGYPLARMELLAFHDIGRSKYEALGEDYAFADAKLISRARMEEFRSLLRKLGVKNVV